MNSIASQSIGAMRFRLIQRINSDHYVVVQHSAAPDVIGIAFAGFGLEHSLRRFDRARDRALASIAADGYSE